MSLLLPSLTEPTDDGCDDSPDRYDDQANPVDHVIPERNSPHVLPLLLTKAHLLSSMSTSWRTLVTLVLPIDGWDAHFHFAATRSLTGARNMRHVAGFRAFRDRWAGLCLVATTFSQSSKNG